MAHILVIHGVEDYAKWKSVFDEDDSRRKTSGGGNYQLYRSDSDPNQIVVLFEWDTVANAQKFAESDELRERMEEAGVTGRPDIYFLNEA